MIYIYIIYIYNIYNIYIIYIYIYILYTYTYICHVLLARETEISHSASERSLRESFGDKWYVAKNGLHYVGEWEQFRWLVVRFLQPMDECEISRFISLKTHNIMDSYDSLDLDTWVPRTSSWGVGAGLMSENSSHEVNLENMADRQRLQTCGHNS